MEEPYTEGVATHGGPEPCVGDPRGRSEALDRGTHRPAIEPRNGENRGADAVMTGGRQHRRRRYARVAGGPREVGEPVHVRNLHAREPGDPTIALPPGTVRAAWGRLRPHARDVRSWEVGLPHSTGEAVEQGRCAAAEMVEGRGQREGNAASTTRPGHRAGTGASSVLDRVRRFGPDRTDVRPERGAQCGSSARWDLCGGPPERAVPTATVDVREGVGEALTGVHTGWAMEPRNDSSPGCRRRSPERKATSVAAFSRAAAGPRVVEEPVHVWSLQAREPGDPVVTRLADHRVGRSGKAKAVRLR